MQLFGRDRYRERGGNARLICQSFDERPQCAVRAKTCPMSGSPSRLALALCCTRIKARRASPSRLPIRYSLPDFHRRHAHDRIHARRPRHRAVRPARAPDQARDLRPAGLRHALHRRPAPRLALSAPRLGPVADANRHAYLQHGQGDPQIFTLEARDTFVVISGQKNGTTGCLTIENALGPVTLQECVGAQATQGWIVDGSNKVHFLGIDNPYHVAFGFLAIDDTHGDARSGLLPQYTPEERWGSEEDKPGLFKGTGHFTASDGVQVNVTMRFHGTQAYVFISVWTATNPIELSFFLDDDVHRPVAHYTRAVDPETNAYTTEDGVLAFASDALPLAQHELVVFSPDSQFPTWLFDYAMYTTEDADDAAPGERTASHTDTSGTVSSLPRAPTPKDPAAPDGRPDIHNGGRDVRVGVSIGGAALLILLLVAACWAVRVWGRRQRATRASRLNPFNARPTAVPELRDKLSLWNDVAEKMTAEQRSSDNDARELDGEPGHEGNRPSVAGEAELRVQLERVRAEKTRALQEIAVLRRVAEPPPYSMRGTRE